jgi:hypothetical protein
MTAGSTVANSMAANKAAQARSQVMAAERARQAALDKEADALNVESRERYTDFPEKMDERGAKLGDILNAPQETAPPELLPASGSTVTVQETQRQKGLAKDYTNKQGQALGNLRAFGDYLGDVSRQQGREAGLVGQIGGFKRGSSDVTAFELDAANQAGAGLKAFGDILALGGSLAGGIGMSGTGAALSAVPTLGLSTGSDPWSSLRTVSTPASTSTSTLRLNRGMY